MRKNYFKLFYLANLRGMYVRYTCMSSPNKVKITLTINSMLKDSAEGFRQATGQSVSSQIEKGLELYWNSPEAGKLIEAGKERSSINLSAVSSKATDKLVSTVAALREGLAALQQEIAEMKKKKD